MQDQIEELEYIKNNLNFTRSPSLISDESDNNRMNSKSMDYRASYDELYRQNLLFFQEAQRLADERRVRTAVANERRRNNNDSISRFSNEDDQSSLNFDQRSVEIDTAQMIDFDEILTGQYTFMLFLLPDH